MKKTFVLCEYHALKNSKIATAI